MDTFCVENGHICFLIPNASRGQRWFQTYISSLLLFFLLLSSDLLSVLQQVSFSKCAKQQIQILWWMLPAWLLNDPPAAMKALCNFKMHSLALHLACFSKTEVFVGSSGDYCAESNMQTGKDDEDLQKALALSLEPVEDWRLQSRTCTVARTTKICRKPWLFGWSLYVWVEEFNRFAQSLGSFVGTHGGLT